MKLLVLLCLGLWLGTAHAEGKHPAASDWVVYYGGGKYDSRETYYFARVAQAGNVLSFDITSMVVGETRKFSNSTNVYEIQLVAILPAKPPGQQVLFPPPNDAQTGAHGDRFVTVYPGKPTGMRAGLADHVGFDVSALDSDVKHVELGSSHDMPTRADIHVQALADAIGDMDPGETRYVWTHHDGKPLFMRVTLYSVEKRVQVPAPAGIAQPPLGTPAVDGVQFVVLAPGSGDPIDLADEVTLDYVVWSPTGRTIEMSPASKQVAATYVFRDQLATMRLGEHRRIWLSPKAAGYYSEAGRGAIADVKMIGLHRNIELLPRGLRIAHQRELVEVVRGTTRAQLPLPIVNLESATLANGVVTFSGGDIFDLPISPTLPLAQLDARLDDVEALAALRAGRTGDAIASAAKALAGAPELDELYTDLARAYLAGGKSHDAAHAVAPLAARNPVRLYVQLYEDAELAPLATEPELAKLRVKSPAKLDLDKQTVLVDRAGRFVAVELTEGSWGSGDSETRIEIIELATGKGVTTIPHVGWSFETQPMTPQIDAEIAARKQQVAGWLADLGFAPPKGVEAGAIAAAAVKGDPIKVTFAKAKLVIDAEGTTDGAFWLPHERALVLLEGRPGHECCEGTDPVWAVVTKR